MKLSTIIIGVILIAPLLFMLMAWPFMWLWNTAIVPAISTANLINYWQAFRLLLFVSLFIIGTKSSD